MLQVLVNPTVELGDPARVNLGALRVFSVEDEGGSPLVQAVDADLRVAQARVLEHLTRVCGMRHESFPSALHSEFRDAFAIWSAMIATAKQPSFR